MAGVYAELKWADGKVNPSGIKTRLFVTPKSNIKTFPKVVASPTTAAQNVTLDGDFVMETGKTFFEVYSTQGKGKVSWEAIGEKDHKMFRNKFNGKFPDISDEAKSMAKSYLNANCVVVVGLPHESEHRYVVIGEEDFDTTVDFKGDSGDVGGSEKGLFMEVTAESFNPLPSYKGEIVLPGGTFDCATSVYTPTP